MLILLLILELLEVKFWNTSLSFVQQRKWMFSTMLRRVLKILQLPVLLLNL